MANAPICKGCTRPIHGSYIQALDATWHPDHFRCAICRKPVTEEGFYVHEGHPCHPACFEQDVAARCSLCDKPLTGKHHANYWGDRYCLDHNADNASCSYCGRYVPHVTKRVRRRSIEDISCDVCASTAIYTAPQAKVLLPSLIAWVESQGMRFREKSFRVEVLDRAEFMQRDGRRDPLGLTTSTRYMRNKRVDRAEVVSVAILQGLPHTLFEGVCIHELGHVWMVQHNIVNLPPIDEEGVCEFISHRHYVETGSKADLFYARRVAENSSPIYGAGFRKVRQLEERVGFAQIIKSLLRKKKLPL